MRKSEQVAYIIARVGGDDGVNTMKNAYIPIINDKGIKVSLIYGKTCRMHKPDGNERFCIPELSFNHPETEWLYNNSFNGVNPHEYWERFEVHRRTIEDKLSEPIKEVDGPVICHNVMALRHFHPALASAIYNITMKMQDKNFVNFGPDPTHERLDHLGIQNNISKQALSRTDSLKRGYEGPYISDNISHLVLNHAQKVGYEKYGVDSSSIHVIPDFQKPTNIDAEPDDAFMKYLSVHCIDEMNGKPKFKSVCTDKNSYYFMCNVRPIERKKLRYAQVVAKNLQQNSGKHVFFVVTHGYNDDPSYFKETVEFSKKLGLDYIYLSDLNGGYDKFLTQMSGLNSIAFISSGAGAWENAINEAIFAKIPVYVNTGLNSYPHLKEMDMKILSGNQNKVYDMIAKCRPEKLSKIPLLHGLVQDIESVMSDAFVRRDITTHNYKIAKKYLSSESNGIRTAISDLLYHTSN